VSKMAMDKMVTGLRALRRGEAFHELSGDRSGVRVRASPVYFINRVHCSVSVYCWNVTTLSP